MTLTYSGTASVNIQQTAQGFNLVVSGIGAENVTHTFLTHYYPAISDMAAAFNTVEGITAAVTGAGNIPSTRLFPNSESSNKLSTTPYRLHYTDENMPLISTDDIRTALEGVKDLSVKAIGAEADRMFQIRVGDDGGDPDASNRIKLAIANSLWNVYGAENIAVIKTDFIGSQFSKALSGQTILLVVVTMGLIWLYATIRFHWDFALAAVIALFHDAFIMLAFITWTQMEVSSLTIAAILTIIGYSINDTVVVFDRIRENVRILSDRKFVVILNISLTETLSRTIITTVTTLLAVVSLYIFTSGNMKDFALALIVGMVSGVYSTLFIAGAFIAATRKNWSGEDNKNKMAVSSTL
jgi:preprotein translocase subunit SecF